jgi:hypothetical protein
MGPERELAVLSVSASVLAWVTGLASAWEWASESEWAVPAWAM